MVTIFFAVARRNPVSGCLTGCVIGLMQDLFAGPNHPLGMYGIALDHHRIPGVVAGRED